MKNPKIFAILLIFCLTVPGLAWGETYHTTSSIVTLTVSWVDDSMWQQMRFSNDNEHWSDPEPVTSAKPNWDMTAYGGGPGYGVKCVYGRFQFYNGNWNDSISACLIWDKPQVPPTPEEPAPSVNRRGCLGIF